MPRFFLEVMYRGTRYSGFQIQENANTVQAEMENALRIFFREPIELTGSSRTDAGVHALQNFFHFDHAAGFSARSLTDAAYHLNAILPDDIVVLSLREVPADRHCRFDALWREYHYFIYRGKDPFMEDRGFFFPYRIDLAGLREAAEMVKGYRDFRAFSKKHGQAKTTDCQIFMSEWVEEGPVLKYKVRGDRFLRGMVRGLVGTMLRVGTGKLSPAAFAGILEAGDSARADFSVPGKGLFLMRVAFEKNQGNVENN